MVFQKLFVPIVFSLALVVGSGASDRRRRLGSPHLEAMKSMVEKPNLPDSIRGKTMRQLINSDETEHDHRRAAVLADFHTFAVSGKGTPI